MTREGARTGRLSSLAPGAFEDPAMKKLWFALAGVFVFACLSLGLLGACVIRAGRSFSYQADEKASRQETHALEISEGQTLRIDLAGGEVRVRAGEGSPGISARITAWGETQEGAQAALAKAELEVASSGSGVTVKLANATVEHGVFGGSVRQTAHADLEIAVPPGVRLQIESGAGDVDAVGPFQASKLHSSYGSVLVENVEGDVVATSSSGDVDVAAARGGSVEATSGYGQVRVGDCASSRIEAKSSSGDVRVEDSRADRFEIESGYGDLELARLDGVVEAKTSSGDVETKALKGPTVTLTTSYGRIQLQGGTGKLSAASSSGDVRISEFEGSVEARSGYGSVHVEGVLDAVEVESSSGDVSVSGSPGTKVGTDWKIGSSYGRGQLELPADLAFDIDARTDYGKIERGFPIELAPGTNEGSAQIVRGKVNGGGNRIAIRCASGDVVFRPRGK